MQEHFWSHIHSLNKVLCIFLEQTGFNKRILVHEDDFDGGIRLPPDFFPMCHEDLTQWHTPLTLHEPEDPSRVAMYPKDKVYAEKNQNIEYSIEEVTVLTISCTCV